MSNHSRGGGDDDVELVICITVAEQPREATVPGSVERWCSICAEAIWMSPEAVRSTGERPHARVVCYGCGVALAAAEPKVSVRPMPHSDRGPAERPVMEMFKRDVLERRRDR